MARLLKLLIIGLLSSVFVKAQQAQPSVKRHPGQHLHYDIALADGDVAKVAGVSVHLNSPTPPPSTQPSATTQLGENCQKSADPKIWNCDITIPPNIADGDYKLYEVD